MAESIQLGAGEQPASGPAPTDNNAGSANAEGAGERSAPLMSRPEWVPEKFFKDGVIDYKGMALQNQELEKQFTQSRQQKAEAEAAAEPKAGEQPKPEDKPAQPPVAIPGVAPERVAHFTEEITKDGKLSDASYDELVKLGYPKNVVDAYVRGLNADKEVESAVSEAGIAQEQINEIKTSVGGDEALKDMIGWAKANWSPARLAAYNKAVGSKDFETVKLAVFGLKSAYSEENGEAPKYIGGRAPSNVDGIQPYLSDADVARDMAKPEYKNSEEFRQKVYARLRISDVFAGSRDFSKVQK
jgi:hypothetical protein